MRTSLTPKVQAGTGLWTLQPAKCGQGWPGVRGKVVWDCGKFEGEGGAGTGAVPSVVVVTPVPAEAGITPKFVLKPARKRRARSRPNAREMSGPGSTT